jgi:nucleotide-binding universal stress UspA family protein
MRAGACSQTIACMTKVIISYDGTENDDDALALGKLLAGPEELALAYIRHSKELDPDREKLAQHDAEQRLEQGAELLGRPDVPKHVVFGASTGAALEELADREGASIVVFGSDYRTQPGHAEPPASAQRLLEIGDTAVGVAASGLRAEPGSAIATIAVVATGGDDTAARSAEALAGAIGAQVIPLDGARADLIVVGSQPGAPAGRVALSGAARTALDASRGSVLVVPSGKPVSL